MKFKLSIERSTPRLTVRQRHSDLKILKTGQTYRTHIDLTNTGNTKLKFEIVSPTGFDIPDFGRIELSKHRDLVSPNETNVITMTLMPQVGLDNVITIPLMVKIKDYDLFYNLEWTCIVTTNEMILVSDRIDAGTIIVGNRRKLKFSSRAECSHGEEVCATATPNELVSITFGGSMPSAVLDVAPGEPVFVSAEIVSKKVGPFEIPMRIMTADGCTKTVCVFGNSIAIPGNLSVRACSTSTNLVTSTDPNILDFGSVNVVSDLPSFLDSFGSSCMLEIRSDTQITTPVSFRISDPIFKDENGNASSIGCLQISHQSGVFTTAQKLLIRLRLQNLNLLNSLSGYVSFALPIQFTSKGQTVNYQVPAMIQIQRQQITVETLDDLQTLLKYVDFGVIMSGAAMRQRRFKITNNAADTVDIKFPIVIQHFDLAIETESLKPQESTILTVSFGGAKIVTYHARMLINLRTLSSLLEIELKCRAVVAAGSLNFSLEPLQSCLLFKCPTDERIFHLYLGTVSRTSTMNVPLIVKSASQLSVQMLSYIIAPPDMKYVFSCTQSVTQMGPNTSTQLIVTFDGKLCKRDGWHEATLYVTVDGKDKPYKVRLLASVADTVVENAPQVVTADEWFSKVHELRQSLTLRGNGSVLATYTQ